MNAVHPYSDVQTLVYSQYTEPTRHHSSPQINFAFRSQKCAVRSACQCPPDRAHRPLPSTRPTLKPAHRKKQSQAQVAVSTPTLPPVSTASTSTPRAGTPGSIPLDVGPWTQSPKDLVRDHEHEFEAFRGLVRFLLMLFGLEGLENRALLNKASVGLSGSL